MIRTPGPCGGITTPLSTGVPAQLPADTDWSLFAKLQPVLDGAQMGSPEKVASVVAMAASDDGSYITGTEIRIDGGTHL
ncbi:SDR family oxidoreductase [Pseudonocardia nigra]|uniref:SDR family oxidoreductase n=1 Tax=Pseudonocardia nigra TaxID=1921578 RepID=UPI001C607B34|nr:SDR family oxidoreductase [Pseudonocardia nigra]